MKIKNKLAIILKLSIIFCDIFKICCYKFNLIAGYFYHYQD